MNISTQQLGRLVRQYPEFFRYGQKLLEHLTNFAVEKKGEVNNENFVHYLEQQKDFEKGELAKIKQGLDSMPAEKDISHFSRDLYTTVLLSSERDSKTQKAIAQAMFVLGAHYAAASTMPEPPMPLPLAKTGLAYEPGNLSQLSSPNVNNAAETQGAVWSKISTDTGSEVSTDQPSTKTDLRKRKLAKKNISQQYSAAQAAAQQQQAPQQAIGRRRKKKKSLLWRLAKITGGATAVGFGGGLFWAGTSTAAILTDFILK